MRVLIIHKVPPFEAGGAEQIIWRIGKRFASNGHRVTFFSPSPEDGQVVPSIPGIDFEWVETADGQPRSQLEFFAKGANQYRSVYRSVEPDLVYDNICPFPFHIAHFYGDAPVMSKVHAIYKFDSFSCKHHPLVQLGTFIGEQTYRLFRNELFVTNSESTKERLISLLNTKRNDVISNPIGIDSSEFEFNPVPDSNTVLSLAKLNPRKGIGTLLNAWSTVEEAIPDVELVVAGSGPIESKLQSQADNLNLSRVRFPGFVSEQEKLDIYKQSSIYVLPTLYEGFGLSNLEAMASGCAVVTTDTWGVKDYMNHGENGCLVDTRSPDELADVLINLLHNRNRILSLAESGRETADSYQIKDSITREIQLAETYAVRSQWIQTFVSG